MLARIFAWRLLRAVDPIERRPNRGTFASGSAGPLRTEGAGIGNARAPSRMGTGLVGRIIPRPRLQTKCLGHATTGGIGSLLARRSRLARGDASAFARR